MLEVRQNLSEIDTKSNDLWIVDFDRFLKSGKVDRKVVTAGVPSRSTPMPWIQAVSHSGLHLGLRIWGLQRNPGILSTGRRDPRCIGPGKSI